MKQNECRKRLRDLLQKQSDGITRANEYLRLIKDAIAESRLEQLQQTLGNPDLALDDIEGLEQQRLQLLGEFGFERDNDGLEKCIAWCDDDGGQLASLYQQLVKNLVELRHSIQVNSLLVNRGQERVRRSIGILTGAGNSTICKTYSNKGESVSPADRRGIAIA